MQTQHKLQVRNNTRHNTPKFGDAVVAVPVPMKIGSAPSPVASVAWCAALVSRLVSPEDRP